MQSTSIDTFYAQVAADAALCYQLTTGATSRDELIARAVAEGQSRGYTFGHEEAAQWLAQRRAAADAQTPVSQELSDEQLEAVAGGKEPYGKYDGYEQIRFY